MAALPAIFGGPSGALAQTTVTSTVRITICGDGQATGFEVCDDGPGMNTGGYATSTAGRHCTPDCMAYGPYCGDSILQPIQSEQCDDGNNILGDRCSDVCVIEDLPSGGGGGSGIPGGSYTPPRETRVVIQGKAYPNANVHILKDGDTVGIVAADGKADFYFTTANVTPGVATFGFWAEDSIGLKSVALTTTLTIIQGAATTISGAFVPPTITLDKRKANSGEPITMSGQSVPSVDVVTNVNSAETIVDRTKVDSQGKWKLVFDTKKVATEEFHTVKALFETRDGTNIVKSAFSQSISFYVGQKDVGRGFIADLNGDGKVNLVDFSILLFYWNTPGPTGDINLDKKVNLSDFSIMLFYWTG